MAKLKATVVFEYQAAASDELTLKVGDVITNVKNVEEGWCEGLLNGKTGMFPDNFVKIEECKSSPQQPSSTKNRKNSKPRMKVTFAYSPENDDELTLEVGDIIEVIKEEEEGWAKGRLRGKEGVFPTNFCVLVAEPSTAPNKSSDIKQLDSEKKIAKNETATPKSPFGNPNSSKASSPSGKHASLVSPKLPSLNRKPTVVEKCRATFDYEAQTNDELSLAEGDIVTILSKNTGDDGWWEGELVDQNGRKKRGVFPDNFVVLLPSTAEENKPRTSIKLATGNNASSVKSKPKITDLLPEKSEQKTNDVGAKKTASLKRPAPQLPPAAKTSPESKCDAKAYRDDNSEVISATDEKQLTHFKRPGGPAGRKKPNPMHRRERAHKAAAEEDMEPEPEPQIAVTNSPPAPVETQTVIKRNQPAKPRPMSAMVPVMRLPTNTDKHETPDWMKKLKSRATLKREPGAVSSSPIKSDDSSKPKPNWLANLQKSKSVDLANTASVADKPTHHFKSVKVGSSVDQSDSVSKDSELDSNLKKFQSRSRSEDNFLVNHPPREDAVVTESKSVEVKKSNRPQVALQPPSMSDNKRPVPTAKPKPPPPIKSKPALPPSKPRLPSTSTDELKDELKSLRKLFTWFQNEHKKELSRLNEELEEERKHRSELEETVAKLRKHFN